MERDEIIEMARQVEFNAGFNWCVNFIELEAFAKLVADKKEAEMQERIDTLHAMYELVCKQRDELMDQQRAQVAALRGKLQ